MTRALWLLGFSLALGCGARTPLVAPETAVSEAAQTDAFVAVDAIACGPLQSSMPLRGVLRHLHPVTGWEQHFAGAVAIGAIRLFATGGTVSFGQFDAASRTFDSRASTTVPFTMATTRVELRPMLF
jgi:hypothetical protein